MNRPIDLVQVRTFVHLYETRSVTATAELMHVAQPSVSYQLGKLRRRFAEELFVRTSHGLEPTAAATGLYEPFRSALDTIDRAADPTERFEPAESAREFSMMLSEFGELSFLPLLLGRIAELAPRARLSVRPLVVDEAPALLTRGQLDLVVSSARLPEELLVRRPFMSVDYVALAAAHHPRLRGELVSAREFAAERYVSVRGTTGHQGPVRLLERLGLQGRVELELRNFAAVPYVVAATSLVAIVPRHIAEIYAARHAVTAAELPWEVEPIEVAAYTRRGPGPARQWLADVVVETLSASRFR
ncbi:LysR family transcriptional regulator [Nocardioides sp. MAHUQ-72]|uniref:LysR family transcriptional regulator n=1 Tax=unclassified Nocardioides TaxID=2615069 RepID=UPI003614D6FE